MSRPTAYSLVLVALLAGPALAPGQNAKPAAPAKDALPDGAVARLGVSRFANFGRIFTLAFTPDGKALAGGSWDGFITWWDVHTHRTVRQWQAHAGAVRGLAVAPGGHTLASGSDGEVRLWTPDGVLRQALPGQGQVEALAFSPDGRRLVSGNWRELRVWDLTGERPASRQVKGLALGFTADSSALALLLRDRGPGERALTVNLVRVDAQTGKEQQRRELPAGPNESYRLSPSARWLARAGYYAPLQLLALPSAREVRLPNLEAEVTGVTIAPDERSLVVACDDGRVLVFELATARVRWERRGEERGETVLAVSPDSRLLASGGIDRTAVLWDLTGRLRGGKVAPVALSAKELAGLWDDLRGGDATVAYKAVWKLAAGARDSVPYLGERLRSDRVVDAGRTAALVRDLASETFAVRTRALKELQALQDGAEPFLRKGLEGSPPLEVRRRLEALVEHIDTWWAGQWRPIRAVEALEHAGTPEARQLLRRLAGNMASPRLADEARAAEERLALRGSGTSP